MDEDSREKNKVAATEKAPKPVLSKVIGSQVTKTKKQRDIAGE